MLKRFQRLLLLFIAPIAWGQMPHETLLVVNSKSQDSLHAANMYIAARNIPRENVVHIDVPKNIYGGTATITPDQFTWLIWEPVNRAVKERRLENQILAWVYSVDFPIRVSTHANDRKQMSVSGLTFTRNKIPGLQLVEEGKFHSKLFAGPNQRLQQNVLPMSLGVRKRGLGDQIELPDEVDFLRDGLGEDMPLPSMHLGYTGEKGTDFKTVLATIGRGLQSDHRGRNKNIFFITSDDVRSTCRAWQFEPAVAELKQRGITAEITTNFPPTDEYVMGLLMGAEEVDPSTIPAFAPGAMAEHLTSWSAEFQKRQTKTTDWLKAGATGSAGAVVEPYSNPNKFPSARFFVMYAAGCTMLESFYQSIACPLQNLLVGDPLAKPYALPLGLKVLGADAIENDFTYLAQAEVRAKNAQILYSFMIDGKEVQAPSVDNSFRLRVSTIADGWHELRVIARVKNMVEFNAMAVKPIVVNHRNRSITLSPNVEKLGKYEHAMRVSVGGSEKPKSVKLMTGMLVLDEKVYTDEVELVLDELMVGEGPNRVRAVAVYSDGMEVSSVPVTFGIKFSTE